MIPALIDEILNDDVPPTNGEDVPTPPQLKMLSSATAGDVFHQYLLRVVRKPRTKKDIVGMMISLVIGNHLVTWMMKKTLKQTKWKLIHQKNRVAMA